MDNRDLKVHKVFKDQKENQGPEACQDFLASQAKLVSQVKKVKKDSKDYQVKDL